MASFSFLSDFLLSPAISSLSTQLLRVLAFDSTISSSILLSLALASTQKVSHTRFYQIPAPLLTCLLQLGSKEFSSGVVSLEQSLKLEPVSTPGSLSQYLI
jgi:hypothetical protein